MIGNSLSTAAHQSGFPNAFLLYAKIKGFLKLDVVQRISEGKFTLEKMFN